MAQVVPLSFVLAENQGRQPSVPFSGSLLGVEVVVMAILDRSVAYEPAGVEWPERKLARPTEVLVDPESFVWRKKDHVLSAHRSGRPKATEEERLAARARTDAIAAEENRKITARKAAEKQAGAAAARSALVARRAQEEAMSVGSSDAGTRVETVLTVVPTADTKVCKVCGQEKPVEKFRWSPLHKSRLATCSACVSVKVQEARLRNGTNLGRRGTSTEALMAAIPSLRRERDKARERLDRAEASLAGAQSKLKELHERLGAALA